MPLDLQTPEARLASCENRLPDHTWTSVHLHGLLGTIDAAIGKSQVPTHRPDSWAGREWPVSGARPHIVEREVDNESWCGLSADRTWRRYRGGQGVCPGGRRPGLRPYCDLRSCPRRRSPIRLRADPNE